MAKTNLQKLREVQVKLNRVIVLYRHTPIMKYRKQLDRLQKQEAKLIKLASKEY